VLLRMFIDGNTDKYPLRTGWDVVVKHIHIFYIQ
jgi:hypothetical protein